VTSQGRPIEIAIDSSGHISSWDLTYLCVNEWGPYSRRLVTTADCDATSGIFTCGEVPAPDCLTWSWTSAIAGSFDFSNAVIHGTVDLHDVDFWECCRLRDVSFVAEWQDLVFQDGFERTSTARWSELHVEDPMFEVAFTMPFWTEGGPGIVRAKLDGATVFELAETPDTKMARQYLVGRVPLTDVSPGNHSLEIEGDFAPFDYATRIFLDDVAIACDTAVENPIQDPSFEGGLPNADWVAPIDGPICHPSNCVEVAARTGWWYLWFGRSAGVTGVQQDVEVPLCPPAAPPLVWDLSNDRDGDAARSDARSVSRD
jgi:hypothetical protein